jgi:hypothetical protein
MPMSATPLPSSDDLARYLEQRGELGKPWMWHLLRLTKLQESKESMDPQEFMTQLQQAHADLMRLGEFWYSPSEVIEPLPGSAEDR